MTASASAAASAGSPHPVAPAATRFSVASLRTSYTNSSWPASSSRSATGLPIDPVPINPIFIVA